jgi:hypothetical protein
MEIFKFSGSLLSMQIILQPDIILGFRVTEHNAKMLMTVLHLIVPEFVWELLYDAVCIQSTQLEMVW